MTDEEKVMGQRMFLKAYKENVIIKLKSRKYTLEDEKYRIYRNILKRLFFRHRLKEIDSEIAYINFKINIYYFKCKLDSEIITLKQYSEEVKKEEYYYLEKLGFTYLQFYLNDLDI